LPQPDFETALALRCMMSGGLHEIGIEGFSERATAGLGDSDATAEDTGEGG